MNETEKDRILRMVAEGTLRPHEAAHLLAALAEEPGPGDQGASGQNAKTKKGAKDQDANLMEVQLQRADGSNYTVKVPPSLVPMIWEITKATVRESARTAAKETWEGLQTVVRRKAGEVKTTVQERFSNPKVKTAEQPPLLTPAQEQEASARRQILQMVQDGNISAEDAGRLIRQLDAHAAYQKSLSEPAI